MTLLDAHGRKVIGLQGASDLSAMAGLIQGEALLAIAQVLGLGNSEEEMAQKKRIAESCRLNRMQVQDLIVQFFNTHVMQVPEKLNGDLPK